jgi:DNA polymerase III epsilon subunit-like protein
MKFVSIDIETTGLDAETCDVLEIGAIINTDDETPLSELPQFRFVVIADSYAGQPYALAMHSKLFAEIEANKTNVQWPATQEDYKYIYGRAYDFARTFTRWLELHEIDPGKFVAAGKNFANFDAKFLLKLCDVGRVLKWQHRILDPSSMYARKDDEFLPGMGVCLKRAGIETIDFEGGAHAALYDAAEVVALIRQFLNGDQTNG